LRSLGKIENLGKSSLDRLLEGIEKPGRYIGQETGTASKSLEQIDLRDDIVIAALVFPDIYEIGMPNLGLQILYDLINHHPDYSAERAFSPWKDLEKRLRELGIRLFSLENRIFLDQFDFIGFSVAHEMLYTNILNILDLSGIPLHSADRDSRFPLVGAGGPSMVNPQPLAEFLDFAVVGDGENTVMELMAKIGRYKAGKKDKNWFLKQISTIEGVYIPSFYKIYYSVNGEISGIKPKKKVKKAVIVDLDKYGIVKNPIVPNIKPVHDRYAVEIMRGCFRGCRFCQAGYIYRPVRQRKVKQLIRQSMDGLKNSGYDEISFLSLSSSDYKELDSLMDGMESFLRDRNISVSFPSMRFDSFKMGIARLIRGGRMTGLTFAPEAGSQEMRDRIGKDLKEQEMLDCVRSAFRQGWEKIKLYFMIGLPGETQEDVRQIIGLIERIALTARENIPGKKRKRFYLNVSINAFCPKPFTPFQWAPQDTAEKLKSKFKMILKGISRSYINISWSDPEKSQVECALSRGDTRVGRVIENAWTRGARFDNWTDFFDYGLWKRAFEQNGLDIGYYTTREFSAGELLPWDVIDIGISKKLLLKQYEKSKAK
jgi:radical SAM family uncharacterized protein